MLLWNAVGISFPTAAERAEDSRFDKLRSAQFSFCGIRGQQLVRPATDDKHTTNEMTLQQFRVAFCVSLLSNVTRSNFELIYPCL